MKLKEIPKNERPRERLIKYGAENLSNEDLISIILGTGTKDINVRELSIKILNQIKSLNDLSNLTVKELTSIKGIGEAKAINLLAAIELGKRVNNLVIDNKISLNNSEKVNKYFSNLIVKSKQEELLVILVNNMKKMIDYKIMFKGTDTSSLVSIKEILNYAITNHASGIIIMHNHPSGNPEPSNADKLLTNKLLASSNIVEIPLLDHIITCGKSNNRFLGLNQVRTLIGLKFSLCL